MMMPEADRAPAPWGAGRALVILGGILLAAALFLPWYVASSVGHAGVLTGIALSAEAPELGILPAIGLIAILGGAVIGRAPKSMRGSTAAWGAIALGLVGIAVSVEVSFRLSSKLQSLYGPAFLDAAALGWYVAILASFLLLASGLFRLMAPHDRFSPAAA